MERENGGMPAWVTLLINLAAMAIILFLLLFFVFRWINSYTRHGEYISVPDITGMVEEEAAKEISASMLRYEISEYRYEAGIPEGRIIEQRPKAGSNVKAERIIHLTVSSGKVPTKALPDVADNSSLRAAEAKLIGAGFKLTETEYIPGDAGWVYEVRLGSRTLQNGEMIPEGSTLTIVAGNGGDPLLTDSLLEEEIDTDFFF